MSSTQESLKSHIVLTSHPAQSLHHVRPIKWGAATARERGPVIATLTNPTHRNVIGTHGGSYSVYRALATSAGRLPGDFRPDLTNTSPAERIGPFPSWKNPEKIVALDPWGADVYDDFKKEIQSGIDIRPSLAVTKAHIHMPEIKMALQAGRLKSDGKIVGKGGDVTVTKVALEPVWYLPGVANRFGISEGELRKGLFQYTGGMFPELVTRHDLKVFLPPIGSSTAYIFGDVNGIADAKKQLTVRVHDECNGSDVFGSDICTCRPYLVHGIEEAIKSAQGGGSGLIIYFRKEGRALGEVTKFLVYNARKRQEGGDSAAQYFHRTECVAGVQDARFQQLMPDALHWFGVTRIDNFISMSDMKHDAIVSSGIKIINRVPIPKELIPDDAQVEMEAKKAAGYFSPEGAKDKSALKKVKGRKLND
jgi:GTP cyclohydrolase II